MRKIQITKHYLRHWSEYDQNLSYLSKVESVKVKILYSALKEMDPEERRFLADKYRVDKKLIDPDEVMAARQGIDFKEYRAKRVAIESKLGDFILKYESLYQSDWEKAFG